MAWVKIPKEHHPIFRDALPPGDKRVQVIPMFGGLAAKVNGYMAGGLFGHSAVVKLGDRDRAAALALDGASPFDPMGNGRVMHDTVMLPDAIMDDRDELRGWLVKAIDHCASLPSKKKSQAPGRKPKAESRRPPAKPAKPAKRATKARR